ncbi:alpha/beta hydrolase-fold protein [Pseudarthrobacter sp. So.54]
MVVVVDPNGSSAGNTLCMDSRIAQADTFLAVDVPAWINRTLEVDPDPRLWAAGGFSFGATCALQMVTRHPDVYGSALAFSSEREPALAKERDKTIAVAFGGDAEAFDRQTPLRLMMDRRFDGHAIYFGAA